MASWLKAAEDLFEVVDRRAKLVVGDLSDEKIDSRSQDLFEIVDRRAKLVVAELSDAKTDSRAQGRELMGIMEASSGSEHQKNANLMIKEENLLSLNAHSDADGDVGHVTPESSSRNTTPNGGAVDVSMGNSLSRSSSLEAIRLSPEVNHDAFKPVDSQTESSLYNASKHDDIHMGIATYVDGNSDDSSRNGDPENRNSLDVQGRHSLSTSDADVDTNLEPPRNEVRDYTLHHVDGSFQSKEQGLHAHEEEDDCNFKEVKGRDLRNKSSSSQTKQQEQIYKKSADNMQEQIDEAQGLLKNAVSTGQSKEARLARVCGGLSSRLQEYKSENAQLEELLVAERELSKSYETRLKQLQKELSESRGELSREKSNMDQTLAAKNTELEALAGSVDALKKQAALTEANFSSLQANMDSVMRNRELTETRIMHALREEVASAERRAEEEHAAHSATKKAAMDREVELEHRAVEASTLLARVQRVSDERMAKSAELEQRVAMFEAECASLNQELQDMEVRVRRDRKKPFEDANQMIQAWKDEAERARQAQRDAERKLASLEADGQKMRVEMAAMKRDDEHYSRQEHMELEKRYRELTDLLYYKQTQLETMTGEKMGIEFQLNKEMKRLQEAQAEAERTRTSRRSSASWDDYADVKALEPLPLHHRYMATTNVQWQKAAKLLDSGAARATRFLWRYPVARVILLFYMVFIHLFLMYLLHRLQEEADVLATKEVAKSMGLTTPILP